MKKISKIKETLLRIGAISEKNLIIFSEDTRDKKGLKVYRDSQSKVIFINEYYIGEEEYKTGEYREKVKPLMSNTNAKLEDINDTERRLNHYRQFFAGKKICDVGCGAGSFLRGTRGVAKSVYGTELQKNFNDALNQEGIECFSSLSQLPDGIDTFFLFHCLEHLPDPAKMLTEIHSKLKMKGEGVIVVEVPHARDFLLDQLELEAFKNFTLWSQHLILHTRDSLSSLLADAGFKNIHVEGIQRYGLSNHLTWLKNATPGGHKSPLSVVETDNLKNSYAEALSKLDANDTLVAIAST